MRVTSYEGDNFLCTILFGGCFVFPMMCFFGGFFVALASGHFFSHFVSCLLLPTSAVNIFLF